jgi:hypothetical protein
MTRRRDRRRTARSSGAPRDVVIGVAWGTLGATPWSVRRTCRECGCRVSVSNREYQQRTDVDYACTDCAIRLWPDAPTGPVASEMLMLMYRAGCSDAVVSRVAAMGGKPIREVLEWGAVNRAAGG